MNARKCISDVRFELQIFSALTQTHNERYGFQLGDWRAGLKISSSLLRLAKLVGEDAQ